MPGQPRRGALAALTRLTNNDAGDYEADWARDGSRSAFSRIVDWPHEVFTMAADGTGRQRITALRAPTKGVTRVALRAATRQGRP
ncbi:MAG: hypothetical protein ACAH81_09270 [Actinomycetota bacterium]